MTRDSVDRMLKSYRFDVGRCGHLEAEIKMLERKAEVMHDSIADDLTSGTQKITGMPFGSGISNPTERVGLTLASGVEPPYLQELRNEIKTLRDEYSERSLTVLFVGSWLKGLNEAERWVIETQVIDGAYWRDVMEQYHIKYGRETSKDTLKRLKTRAMEKVYKMAE